MNYTKLLPEVRADTKEFWEGCKQHEFRVPKCRKCGTHRFPPRPMCHNCNSTEADWIKVSGNGEIHSWIVVRDSMYRPARPGFKEDIPYIVALADFPQAGNIRLLSNMVDCKPDDMHIGMRVKVIFDDVTDVISLPKFKQAEV
jgi:uncharacterized OB-fold protein